MACTACCFCFSGDPLGEDDFQGKRGGQYGKFANHREKFQISMGDAPIKNCFPCCLAALPCTFVCAAPASDASSAPWNFWPKKFTETRDVAAENETSVLFPPRHAAPHALQGPEPHRARQRLGQLRLLPGLHGAARRRASSDGPSRRETGAVRRCCCFHPGACCEKDIPRTCMCIEACCCAGLAVSSTRFVMMEQYHFMADECDNRLIRFNNCIQVLSCICHVLAIFKPQFRDLAQIIDLIADIVFFSTAGCMTAQVDYEINYRESLGESQGLPGGPVGSPINAMPQATVVGVAQPAGASPPYVGAPAEPEGMDR